MHSVGHAGRSSSTAAGPQISDLMERLGKEPEFRDGLRVTDAETVDIARMVLVGKVNREIVVAINVHGPLAVGLSGEDAGLIVADARDPDARLRRRRRRTSNPAILERLLAEDLIPVVSTIGADAAGQAYNINADTVAGAARRGARRREARLPHRRRRAARATSPTRRASSARIDAAELAALIARRRARRRA